MRQYTLYRLHATGHCEPVPSDALLRETGCCAAVGFFDGVHQGHRFLIDQLRGEADRRGTKSVVITFEEHPRLALSGARYWPELLTSNAEKLRLLALAGADYCAMLRFDHAMSMLTSAEFMEQVLKACLGVQCLMVGYDHSFGSDLSSGFAAYVRQGKDLGMDVLRLRPYDVGELRVSSSAVRRFLAAGNVETARLCLGRPYLLEGTVVQGRHAGTLMGYPTANLQPLCAEQIVPGRGVYAVRAEVDGFTYMAMLNIGWRPTMDNGDDQTVEAHLLDYDGGDLYGKRVKVYFYQRVRDERRFASVQDLQAQLAVDADTVRSILSKA